MIAILIPAYKPDEKMLNLLDELIQQELYAGFLVLDDGSGTDYRPFFEAAEKKKNVVVMRHAVNQGKGRALKSGINAIMNLWPEANVITADADGQHTPADIRKVAQELESAKGKTLVLGKRSFGQGTPTRSLWGNTITRYVFALSTGHMVYDTQTGLRGITADLLPDMLSIPGERYEYEMNVLLRCVPEGCEIREVEIETVYLNNNSGSHFNPMKDALMVFSRVLFFAASSLCCFVVDYGCYALLIELAGLEAGYAQIGARIVSSILNFAINRNLVFRMKKGSFARQLFGYYALVLLVMILSFFGIELGTNWLHGNEYVVKLLVDVLLGTISFLGQRLWVFRPKTKEREE